MGREAESQQEVGGMNIEWLHIERDCPYHAVISCDCA